MKTVIVSVGTDHHPFDRMLQWAARAQREADVRFIVQRGATAPLDGVESFDYVPAPELEARMRSADAVVCHGGPGTIGLCHSAGQRPIVVPRDPELGEHVDDHQMRYSSKLAAEGVIDIASSCDELIALLMAERVRPSNDATNVGQAVEEFAALADALLAGDLAKRSLRERLVFRRSP